jgi:hypothetical protein
MAAPAYHERGCASSVGEGGTLGLQKKEIAVYGRAQFMSHFKTYAVAHSWDHRFCVFVVLSTCFACL